MSKIIEEVVLETLLFTIVEFSTDEFYIQSKAKHRLTELAKSATVNGAGNLLYSGIIKRKKNFINLVGNEAFDAALQKIIYSILFQASVNNMLEVPFKQTTIDSANIVLSEILYYFIFNNLLN